MRSAPDARRRRGAIAALCAAGFALSVWLFYPGILTWDAWYIHRDAMNGSYGDWQSPLVVGLWRLIDPLAPGTASMFLFIAALYWASFGALALTLARRSGFAVLIPLLAATPPAFFFTGVIWRDIIFGCTWLLAATLALTGVRHAAPLRLAAQAIALLLVGCGVLIRPNALIAAPLLATVVLWPRAFSWKRALLMFVPAAAAFYLLVPLIYYGAFGAERQHPLQSLMVYDLGGVTHFAKENQFPVAWTPEQSALLLDTCYSPELWDVYWTRSPCSFVMGRLQEEKLFGTSAISSAWIAAITHHPLAYLQHRADVFWTFLAGDNMVMWTVDIEDQARPLFPGRARFAAVVAMNDALRTTPLCRIGSWLTACLLFCALAWRRRGTPEGAFVIGVCGSAAIYVLTFAVVGVAADFRYGLWAVIAALSAPPVLLTASSAGAAEKV